MFSPKYVELKLHSTKHNRNVAVITMIDKTYNIIKYKNDSMEDSEVFISLNSLIVKRLTFDGRAPSARFLEFCEANDLYGGVKSQLRSRIKILKSPLLRSRY